MNILGIGAHPDDLDFSAAGTFAKWAIAGHSCYHLICTDGRKGSDDPKMTEDKLVKIRQKEQISAGKILGLREVHFLKHHDTELAADPELKREIVRYIRKLKPEIVLTLDPAFMYSVKTGFINHTDHRAVAIAAMDAVFPLARDRLTFPELESEGLKPHKVKTLYFTGFENPNHIEDVSETFHLKLKALAAHVSQVDEKGLDRTEKRAAELGKQHGYKYAEGFIRLELPI